MALQRREVWPAAQPMHPPSGDWPSEPWERPGPLSNIAGIVEAVRRAVGDALGRRPTLQSLHADKLRDTPAIHFGGKGTDHDILLVHDDVDVLLVTCSSEADDAMRANLERDGYPAAMRAVAEAARVQHPEAPERAWILEQAAEAHNPVVLAHASAAVTTDFGLHDGMTGHATMLSTRTRRPPPSTKMLRGDAHKYHRAECRRRLSRSDGRHFSPAHRFDARGAEVCPEQVMLPAIRRNSTPLATDKAAIAVARFEGCCRAAASDLSLRFFNSTPGVRALAWLQTTLQRAEIALGAQGSYCPFVGAAEYLYT